LGEVAVTLRRLVDDVQGSGEDDVQRCLALAVLENEIPPREGLVGAELGQVLDLLRRQAGEERRMVGIEEVLDGGGRVVGRRSSDSGF
jgi:hypothetical protein